MAFLVLVWILFVVVTGSIVDIKGYKCLTCWIIFAFILPPVAFIVAIILPPRKDSNW